MPVIFLLHDTVQSFGLYTVLEKEKKKKKNGLMFPIPYMDIIKVLKIHSLWSYIPQNAEQLPFLRNLVLDQN